MSTPLRLLSYAGCLVVLFVVAFAVGRYVLPGPTTDAEPHVTHSSSAITTSGYTVGHLGIPDGWAITPVGLAR